LDRCLHQASARAIIVYHVRYKEKIQKRDSGD